MGGGGRGGWWFLIGGFEGGGYPWMEFGSSVFMGGLGTWGWICVVDGEDIRVCT